MSDKIRKATTIPEIYYAVGKVRPLNVDELDEFYQETNSVRSEISPRNRLSKIIRKNVSAGVNGHFLFVGSKGAGKSTELNHLQKDLEQEIAVINYSVFKELDPQNISYIELFIVTMEKLFNYASDKGLNIDNSLLDRIETWTSKTSLEEVKDKQLEASVEAGSKTEFGIAYLQKFFLNLKVKAKASRSFKETLKNEIEPKLSDLIAYCNELITKIRLEIITLLDKKDLLIIIEDLDKIPTSVASGIFLEHCSQLVQINCNIIYTYPVALYYHPSYITIRDYFSTAVELPMIKVKHKNGTDYEDGINAMKNVIYARMTKELFKDEGILIKMIKITGGVLRDLFRMINDAADFAEEKANIQIEDSAYLYAYRELQKEYSNSIAPYTENGNTITADEFYQTLKELAMSTDKKPNNSETLFPLRQNLCVLTYNGENWCDVHPIVKDILIEKGLLNIVINN